MSSYAALNPNNRRYIAYRPCPDLQRQDHAVATYVLITIVKKERHLDASLYTCLQILSVSVFEKTELSCALQPDRSRMRTPFSPNQLLLFNF